MPRDRRPAPPHNCAQLSTTVTITCHTTQASHPLPLYSQFMSFTCIRFQQRCVDRVLPHLIREYNYELSDECVDLEAPADPDERRTLLRDLLTMRSTTAPLPDHILADMDALLASEQQARPSFLATDLSRPFGKLSLWRGDITTLRCDAIVNAANCRLLGCFEPVHRCIDNVIHAAAGPRLRAACSALMQQRQGQPEPNGLCKVTTAFSLPCRYVLHTVGPQLSRGQRLPTLEQQRELGCCYRSCLDAADQLSDVKSIAFCCISTGVFGYPRAEAATTAIDAVNEWLGQHPTSCVQHIIFNVFTDEDESIYRQWCKINVE